MNLVQARHHCYLHLRALLDSRNFEGSMIEQVFGIAKTCVECRSSEEFELGDKDRRGMNSRGSQRGPQNSAGIQDLMRLPTARFPAKALEARKKARV